MQQYIVDFSEQLSNNNDDTNNNDDDDDDNDNNNNSNNNNNNDSNNNNNIVAIIILSRLVKYCCIKFTVSCCTFLLLHCLGTYIKYVGGGAGDFLRDS